MQALVVASGHVTQRVLCRMGHRIRAVRVHEVVRRVDFDDVTGLGDPMGKTVLQDGVGGRGWASAIGQISLL